MELPTGSRGELFLPVIDESRNRKPPSRPRMLLTTCMNKILRKRNQEQTKQQDSKVTTKKKTRRKQNTNRNGVGTRNEDPTLSVRAGSPLNREPPHDMMTGRCVAVGGTRQSPLLAPNRSTGTASVTSMDDEPILETSSCHLILLHPMFGLSFAPFVGSFPGF